MTDQPINSRPFWEEYFVEDWASHDGPGQSRHFMLQLLAHLPLPDLSWLIASAPTILDWGCATGEGTEMLAKLLPNSGVTGLDFARIAIDTAAQRHRQATFLWDPEGSVRDIFDVIVTSNCLEHFADPLSVALAHIERCRHLYLALVPYREHPLHDQHFAQFRDESFPERIGTFSRIAVQPFPVDNDYWPGWQVLAAYGAEDYLRLRESTVHSCPAVGPARALLNELVAMSADVAKISAKVRSERAAQAELISTIQRHAVEMATMQAQAVVNSTELETTRHQLEIANEQGAELQELADAERHLREVADQQIQHVTARLADVAEQLGKSTRLLVREETRVLRPILRRTWHTSRALARHLPPRWQDSTRASLAPFVRLLAPKSPQATFYQMARQRRGYQAWGNDTSPPPAGLDVDTVWREAFWARFQDREPRLTFFVFPIIDWHFRFQRPQQLAKALGERGHTVIYISPDFMSPNTGQAFEFLGSPAHNVRLYRLACPPTHPRIYETLLLPTQAAVLARNLAELEASCSGGGRVRIVQHPFWARLMHQWDVGLLQYDLMDEHSGFAGNGDWLEKQETDLLDIADLVTVTSEPLSKRVSGSKSLTMRNAADRGHFEHVMPRDRDATPVRIGYYGAIAHWFDSTLVRDAARAHPDWEFELVGSTFQADLLDLGEMPNVALRGEKSYDVVPDYLSRWDVAIIPFKILPLTQATNPVKVYEYLTAGKPVVATRLPELMLPPVSDWVRLASGSAEFIAALEKAVGEARDPALAFARRNAVRDESWAYRAEQLERAFEAHLSLVSIVVVCYGQLDLTKSCLRSLFDRTDYPNWELVVVDNASPDGTASWLREVASRTDRLKLVLNEENVGFAAGVNSGVRCADGDYIIVMNNDVQVTPGWLQRMVRHLRNDQTLGLVGPVTNAIGNEAAIEISYSNEKQMLTAASLYTASHFRQTFLVENVAFFTVGFTKRTWDAVGDLDESYGLGYFEDDDYCMRVRATDLKIAVAEDTFVHHQLSASFDAIGAARKKAQFDASRAVFEKKWGPWETHQYRRQRGSGGSPQSRL